jgi:hypothetical protein
VDILEWRCGDVLESRRRRLGPASEEMCSRGSMREYVTAELCLEGQASVVGHAWGAPRESTCFDWRHGHAIVNIISYPDTSFLTLHFQT